jgi:hypothetical protein
LNPITPICGDKDGEEGIGREFLFTGVFTLLGTYERVSKSSDSESEDFESPPLSSLSTSIEVRLASDGLTKKERGGINQMKENELGVYLTYF